MTNIQAYRGVSINVASEEAEGHMDGVDAMATQHTPGPWSQGASDSTDEHFYTISADFRDRKTVIARVEYNAVGWEEREANARLIAAAPETALDRDELREKFLTASNEAHRQRIQREAAETKCAELLAALNKIATSPYADTAPVLRGIAQAAIANAEAK